MATQTFRDFMTECECYEYSTEYYEMIKESYEISLMEQYIANQQFVLENADLINSNTFTESTFVESSSIDINQIEVLTEEVEKKKESLLKRAWERLKKVFQGVLSFFKRILGLNKKIEEQTKEVAKKWKVRGGLDGVVKHIIKKAKDKIVEDTPKETDKETSKDSDKSEEEEKPKETDKSDKSEEEEKPKETDKSDKSEEEDPDYYHDTSNMNKLQQEFYKTIRMGSMVTIQDYGMMTDEYKTKILNFIHQKVLKSSGSASAFFDPSSNRDIVYDIYDINRYNDYELGLLNDCRIKVIKHKPNTYIIPLNAHSLNYYLDPSERNKLIETSEDILNGKEFTFSLRYNYKDHTAKINKMIDDLDNRIASLEEGKKMHPDSNAYADVDIGISTIQKVIKGLTEYQLLYQALLHYQRAYNNIRNDLLE